MSEERYVPWDVHKEFVDRINERDNRQDERLRELEATVKEIGRLTVAVEKMAVNMGTMATELSRQGERLEQVEKQPAKRWETVVTGILAAIVGAIGAAIASGIIH